VHTYTHTQTHTEKKKGTRWDKCGPYDQPNPIMKKHTPFWGKEVKEQHLSARNDKVYKIKHTSSDDEVGVALFQIVCIIIQQVIFSIFFFLCVSVCECTCAHFILSLSLSFIIFVF